MDTEQRRVDNLKTSRVSIEVFLRLMGNDIQFV